MRDLFNLEGKVAIVTGGNGGIGKAIARGLASMGVDVAIVARNEAKISQTVEELKRDFSKRIVGIKTDVRCEDQIQSMVSQLLNALGRIDILINNAGISIRRTPQEYTIAEWDEILETNLRSAFLCSQAVYTTMKEARGGKIINISSIAGILGAPKGAPYCASKGGMIQLTRALAVAWAQDNIQVNTILPGFIETDMSTMARQQLPKQNEQVVSRVPVGRWGQPEELVGAAIFLASPASDFVTGVALPVDGGYTSTI